MVEEMELVYEAALEALRRGESAALATVIEAQGSTPRGTSAKMLVYADGRSVGTVGGGGVESRVIEEAKEVIAAGEARELHYSLVDEERGDPGICGGDMRIFVEPLVPRPLSWSLAPGTWGRRWRSWRTIWGTAPRCSTSVRSW
jgi:xanthine dehydrogenase accessory factor